MQLGHHCKEEWRDKTSGQAWLAGSPDASVHLFEEFISRVLVTVVLHFVELPLFRCQHGVDLLRENTKTSAMTSNHRVNWVNVLFRKEHVSGDMQTGIMEQRDKNQAFETFQNNLQRVGLESQSTYSAFQFFTVLLLAPLKMTHD